MAKSEFIEWGEVIVKDGLPKPLLSLLDVVEKHNDCEFVEAIRVLKNFEALVVDFGDGTFETDNSIGVQRIERLALCYNPKAEFCWDVRALRKDFPLSIHQNHTADGEPRSLCLYYEPWPSVERTWTAQNFIKKIFWWLRSTAEETIHPSDQPIEQLFFKSKYQFVLPDTHFDLFNQESLDLIFGRIDESETPVETVVGRYENINSELSETHAELPYILPITIVTSAIENGPVEDYPFKLGELKKRLELRGVDLLESLQNAIRRIVPEEGGLSIDTNLKSKVLLIMGIPRKRNGRIERMDVQGFLLHVNIGLFGESLGVLLRNPADKKKWFLDIFGNPNPTDYWEQQAILPTEVQFMPSAKEIRKFSGLRDADCEFEGVLAGVGALGSSLAETWAREKWGNWDFVDDDIVKPHNLVRHISNAWGVGFSKVKVLNDYLSNMFSISLLESPLRHVCKFDVALPKIRKLIERKDLIVDATTTLEVPRELYRSDCKARVASVFLTPNGMSSVLLLEDQERETRTISLEAQYYRAIIHSDSWGKEHLDGSFEQFWVGAGCRDISVSLSNELVKLHSSMIGRQLRLALKSEKPQIYVWTYNDESACLKCDKVPVAPSKTLQVGDWEVLWDEDIESSLIEKRKNSLPDETGGVLLGFIDVKLKSISLVLAGTEPSNSISSPFEFSRGTEGVLDTLEESSKRTANIVRYIGEWHSHPKCVSSALSSLDILQLDHLSKINNTEGLPAVMLVVAEGEVSISVKTLSRSETKVILTS
ncbi:ThiF family adenylyltransferase [Pseudoalteromonas sp. bablab_jr004]|uniref:ThiF family adenylyltransferase n=1 Tax=Pseudoalteromonas sp. bablab_jr004 TaxID=2755065 RepID=UPI0018F39FCB|nr:ThiF family adenylyltransferase [Pseudoalteromonas sp. bablab_jr004]